uniref:Uncharacterized protein n=1 Tax=Myotis myotis TaxID=51298 RepID=A0A7J7UCT3_MYOMY|nr:hypothetical protein mMyoMyo1_008708 [Myotis myotis]
MAGGGLEERCSPLVNSKLIRTQVSPPDLILSSSSSTWLFSPHHMRMNGHTDGCASKPHGEESGVCPFSSALRGSHAGSARNNSENRMQPKIGRIYPCIWNSPSVWLVPILRFEEFLHVNLSSFKDIAGSLWFASGFSPSSVALISCPLSP